MKMKKILYFVLVSVLLAPLCLALSACGKTSIVGKWQTKLDPKKLLGAESDNDSASSDPFADVEFSGDIKLYIEFASDGKYTVSFDKDDFKTIMSEAADVLVKELMASLGGSDMSVEDALEIMGVSSKEEFVAQMLEEDGFEDKTGEYKYSDEELTLGDVSYKVDLAKKALVIKEAVAADEDDDFAPMLPLEFERVS